LTPPRVQQRPRPEERLAYRVDEAAAALCVSKRTIYNRIKDGTLTPRKVGNCTLIPANQLAALLNVVA